MTHTPPVIRILLADDHDLFRSNLAECLGRVEGFSVVASVSTGAAAVAKAGEAHPHVLLLDIAMAGLGGLEAAAQIRRSKPDAHIILLSMYDDEEYIARAVKLNAGYWLKDAPFDAIVGAIRSAHGGTVSYAPRILEQLLVRAKLAINADMEVLGRPLTTREGEVLKMLAEGLSIKDVARVLVVAVKTAEAHKFNLMKKLGLHNRATLTLYAIRKKIIVTV